jgi:hypothetical protein
MYSKEKMRYIAKIYTLNSVQIQQNFLKEINVYDLIMKDSLLKENLIHIKDIVEDQFNTNMKALVFEEAVCDLSIFYKIKKNELKSELDLKL